MSVEQKNALVKRILIGISAFLALWIMFFDTHSVYTRIQMIRERDRLKSENAMLRVKIEAMETTLATPLTNEDVEKIAREELGMTRPGDRVYPVIVKR